MSKWNVGCEYCSIKTPHLCRINPESGKIAFIGWYNAKGKLIKKLPKEVKRDD